MIRRIAGLLAIPFFLLALPDGPAAAGEAAIELGKGGALMLPLPKDWSHDVHSPDADLPPTVELQAAKTDTVVLITPVWAVEGGEPDFGTAAACVGSSNAAPPK